MKACFLSLVVTVAALVPVASAQEFNFLELMNEAVNSSPAIAVADSDLARANATRTRLELGPYTAEFSATGGSRSVNEPALGNVEYFEWSATAARTFRLPSKAEQDRRLGSAEVNISNAQRRLYLVDERLMFVRLWTTWTQLHALSEISSELADGARRLAEVEQKKVLAGAGRKMDADQADLEAMQFALIAERDASAAKSARSALQVRYPDLTLPLTPQTLAVEEITKSATATTIVTPAEQAALARSERASLVANRVRLDALPDPTFSMGFSNDFGGRETALVFGVSIPFGGSVQRSRYNEAAQEATLAQKLADQARWENAQVLISLESAVENYERLMLRAEANVAAANATLAQFEAGYALGEVLIRDLLMARRSALDVQKNHSEYRNARDRAALEQFVLKLP